MAGLSTHALDLVYGGPANGLKIDFFERIEGTYRLTKSLFTNQEGRTDKLFISAEDMRTGQFQFIFHLGDYFAGHGPVQTQIPIFNRVPVRFAIADVSSHYHVPILIAPWGYTIYRGS